MAVAAQRAARSRRARSRCCTGSAGRPRAASSRSPPRARARGEVFVLRRGARVVADGELARRALVARLARLVALDGVARRVRGRRHRVSAGRAAPGPARRRGRARTSSSSSTARSPTSLVRELAGVRLWLRPSSRPIRQLRRGRSPHARRDRAAAPARSDLAARAHAAVPAARVPPLPARGRRARCRGRGRREVRADARRRSAPRRRRAACSASTRTPTSRRSSAPTASSRARCIPISSPRPTTHARRALERAVRRSDRRVRSAAVILDGMRFLVGRGRARRLFRFAV